MASSNMTSKNCVAGFEECSFCTELASDMASHTGFHVDLAIFRHINNNVPFNCIKKYDIIIHDYSFFST